MIRKTFLFSIAALLLTSQSSVIAKVGGLTPKQPQIPTIAMTLAAANIPSLDELINKKQAKQVDTQAATLPSTQVKKVPSKEPVVKKVDVNKLTERLRAESKGTPVPPKKVLPSPSINKVNIKALKKPRNDKPAVTQTNNASAPMLALVLKPNYDEVYESDAPTTAPSQPGEKNIETAAPKQPTDKPTKKSLLVKLQPETDLLKKKGFVFMGIVPMQSRYSDLIHLFNTFQIQLQGEHNDDLSVSTCYHGKDGTYLEFASDDETDEQNKLISQITLSKNTDILPTVKCEETARLSSATAFQNGMHLGMSKEDVIDKMGIPEDVGNHKFIYSLADDHINIEFDFDQQDHVESMALFQEPLTTAS